MWTNFFHDGGWGMYPTALFSFFLLAAAILHAVRPDKGLSTLVACLGATTMSAGLLGTTVGVVTSLTALPSAPPQMDRLTLGALGCAESLHNLVLALMVVTLCGLIASIGSFRAALDTAPNARAK